MLHADLQLAHFIAALDNQVFAQVALSDALGRSQCLPQGHDDLPSDHPGGQQPEKQRQSGNADQGGTCTRRLGIALDGLAATQLSAGGEQRVAQRFHGLLRSFGLDLNVFELTQFFAIAL